MDRFVFVLTVLSLAVGESPSETKIFVFSSEFDRLPACQLPIISAAERDKIDSNVLILLNSL